MLNNTGECREESNEEYASWEARKRDERGDDDGPWDITDIQVTTLTEAGILAK